MFFSFVNLVSRQKLVQFYVQKVYCIPSLIVLIYIKTHFNIIESWIFNPCKNLHKQWKTNLVFGKMLKMKHYIKKVGEGNLLKYLKVISSTGFTGKRAKLCIIG